ncbi:MAG TPA: YigZ family protein [Ruminiclostridium sp.]|nr:YigZ family protein [Ruminiclostridium sp.]
MKSYKTIQKEGTYILEERRSRFIARARPVSDEQEAVSFIQSVKTSCWDATHNCYAYSVETDALYQRYSDDGEPQGTAGFPILEVIRKRELQNLVVVVTRYFGGILLGAGGLVRAYGKACSGSLDAGKEIFVKPCLEIEIPIEYHLAGKLQNALINEGFILGGTNYTEEVTFTVYSPKERLDFLEEQIREITGGLLRLEVLGNKNIRLDKGGKVLEDIL